MAEDFKNLAKMAKFRHIWSLWSSTTLSSKK